jgi:hypothetical protein
MPPSLSQRLIFAFVSPETAKKMEADSRAWKVHCPHCHFVRSIWDMGGIRYRAYGNPYKLRLCPSCGKVGWHKTTYEPSAA